LDKLDEERPQTTFITAELQIIQPNQQHKLPLTAMLSFKRSRRKSYNETTENMDSFELVIER
jgi:hypothetical protein